MHILMHFQGVILGFVFLGMIVTPALVAARSGKEELQPDPVDEAITEARPAVARRSAPPVRTQETIMPVSKEQAPAEAPAAPYYTSTVLPIHGRMGMAGR